MTMNSGRTLSISAEPLHAQLVRRTVLDFPPPLAELSPSPDRFRNEWVLLQGVFELPPPSSIPALDVAAEDQEPLLRFIATCEELAGYRIWSSPTYYEINFASGMTFELPPREEVQAALTQFRQLFFPDEKASFRVVNGILGKYAHAADDKDASARRASLKSWHAAHGRLRADAIEHLADCKIALELRQPPPEPNFGQEVSPEQLISEYAYGDLIHWGSKREALHTFSSVPMLSQMREFSFITALAQLSHFYFGYSQVCRQFVLPTRSGPDRRSGQA